MERGIILTALLLQCLPNTGCGPSQEKRAVLKAGEAFVAAQKAKEAGDSAEALTILTASLEEYRSTWSYFERAKLYFEAGRIEEALADCDAALELDSEHADVNWFKQEIKKSPDERFKGKNAQPPSAGK